MASFAGAFAASHGPLLVRGWEAVPSGEKARLKNAFDELGRRLKSANPDVLIVVSPDHWSNFFLDNYPAVCLGVGAANEGPPEPWMKGFAHRDIPGHPALALHIAEAVRRRHPDLVMPAEVAPYFAEMGRVGSALARKAAEAIRTRDLVRAGQMEGDDDAMDDLHRHLLTVLVSPTWPHGVGPAVDITLIGRFYERYADHAVALAHRVVYVVTGRMPDPVAA
jgi:phosphate uptake regulator